MLESRQQRGHPLGEHRGVSYRGGLGPAEWLWSGRFRVHHRGTRRRAQNLSSAGDVGFTRRAAVNTTQITEIWAVILAMLATLFSASSGFAQLDGGAMKPSDCATLYYAGEYDAARMGGHVFDPSVSSEVQPKSEPWDAPIGLRTIGSSP